MRLALWLASLLLATPAFAACELGAPGVIHRPAGLGSPAPLVLLLHGSSGTGAAMLETSGLAATADAHGFLIAAPDGGIKMPKGFAWNVPGVPTTAGGMPSAADRNDTAFLLALIDRLVAERCVDPARVYVTGLSGGGRMTSWLGCVAADKIAAIAPVVGLRAGRPLASDPRRPDPDTCHPTRPMPVMAFAGDADTVNPIDGGGAPYWQYPMEAALVRWATLDGCTAQPSRHDLGAALYEERYAGCRAGSAVVARITRGGTHRWLADNEALWTFLSAHHR